MQTMITPVPADHTTQQKKSEHTVAFKVKCYAVYKSQLTLPDEFFQGDTQIATDDEILTFVRTHLPDASVDELEFLDDLEDITDSVWQEDIREVV